MCSRFLLRIGLLISVYLFFFEEQVFALRSPVLDVFGWVLFFEKVIPLGESFVLPRRGIVTFDIQVDDF